ncbi:MAG: DUF3046 domain-containing protein [Corynebacterium sp.]|uniref:DUF3046 domain-containing protein n=1 Tax=Candidatus Corynebacterium faecigallinarum TaxID=2838528 RepID=A0A9D2QDX2_9CORY|nr:DUF3046 domain-containing protein [Corynebacterium sp.]HJC84338.1 DUF3046 domain-containing protein [Candidatus Corynebacterium faecigallinarum]MDN5721931.1 DUF3046 domain-containing protein [Corynebacterium sp.]MDN6283280.1 DUF3046 domain-containing protein [Corynebacterium sp.]MDN6306649.1 DUF3046 domain-containing protein [Corynebacterium sp.]MDN6352623.1 DUF3046 domain-containing protein [Corynebacterium sp.]
MRRTEFDRLVTGEFGDSFGTWIAGSHVLQSLGRTSAELIEQGHDLREIWLSLCDDFDVPSDRRLGEDL